MFREKEDREDRPRLERNREMAGEGREKRGEVGSWRERDPKEDQFRASGAYSTTLCGAEGVPSGDKFLPWAPHSAALRRCITIALKESDTTHAILALAVWAEGEAGTVIL